MAVACLFGLLLTVLLEVPWFDTVAWLIPETLLPNDKGGVLTLMTGVATLAALVVVLALAREIVMPAEFSHTQASGRREERPETSASGQAKSSGSRQAATRGLPSALPHRGSEKVAFTSLASGTGGKIAADNRNHDLQDRLRLHRAVDPSLVKKEASFLDETGMPPSQGPVALIIEDDPMAAALLEYLLSQIGWRCVKVYSGEAAVLAVSSMPTAPDAIIADYHLPGIDGLAGICAVRDSAGKSSPACLMTGDLSPDLRLAAKAANVRFLAKPINNNEIEDFARVAAHSWKSSAPGPEQQAAC